MSDLNKAIEYIEDLIITYSETCRSKHLQNILNQLQAYEKRIKQLQELKEETERELKYWKKQKKTKTNELITNQKYAEIMLINKMLEGEVKEK